MNEQELESVIKQIIGDPARHGLTVCTLCKDPPSHVSAFFTTEKFGERIGAPKGKRRVILYCLCDRCFELPDKTKLVERKILQEMGTQ